MSAQRVRTALALIVLAAAFVWGVTNPVGINGRTIAASALVVVAGLYAWHANRIRS